MVNINCSVCHASVEAASATMTADGMKCSNCVASIAISEPEMLAPAGSMPGKLAVVIGLMAISVLLNILTTSLISGGIGIALIAGILVGNNGVRLFVKALVWLQLLFQSIGLVAVLALNETPLLLASLFSVGISVFVIWTLMQDDVRTWMFKTAFKDGLDDV
jgi:hypothetical protein